MDKIVEIDQDTVGSSIGIALFQLFDVRMVVVKIESCRWIGLFRLATIMFGFFYSTQTISLI